VTQSLNTPLQLGRKVKGYGKVAAVGTINGERYYWLVDCREGMGAVAMLPASVLEPMMRRKK
jgi:hypothetical protein